MSKRWKSLDIKDEELEAAKQEILQAALTTMASLAPTIDDNYSDVQEMLAILKALHAARDKKHEIVSRFEKQHPNTSVWLAVDIATAVCSVAVATDGGQHPEWFSPPIYSNRGGQVAYNLHRALSAIERLDAMLLDFAEDDPDELVPSDWFEDEMSRFTKSLESALVNCREKKK